MMDRDRSQLWINREVWAGGGFLVEYANRHLLPVEVLLLVRYREQLSGRALDLGCGAGRVLGYLVALGGTVHGIDISPEMVAHCNAAYPSADVQVGDLTNVAAAGSGTYTAILAMDNVLDVFADTERRQALRDIRPRLDPDGILIFSGHNAAYLDSPTAHERRRMTARVGGAARKLLSTPPEDVRHLARRLPTRIRNRRRLAPLQRRAADHAIVNDSAHDYSLLHYYITRDDQEQQLRAAGYELLDCLDPDGVSVPAGATSRVPWLHYVAVPAAA